MIVRGIGLALMVVSVPLFFFLREYEGSQSSSLMRRWIHTSVFLSGVFGLCLVIFGGIVNALAVLAVWSVVAWLYNR